MSSPIDTASVAIVPDFSRFNAQARAGIDAALRGVVGDIRTAFDQVERAASDAGSEIGRDFQRGGESAESALREVSATARTQFGQVENSAAAASAGMSTRLHTALDSIMAKAKLAATALGAGLVATTGFGLKSAATMEQTQVAFDSLLGSVAAGQKAFKDLQQFAAVTPFTFNQITGASQRFFAFANTVGLSKDQVTQFLTTIGNVASVTGGGAEALNSVALAFGQMASSGKVNLQDLNQISQAMPGFSGVAAIAAARGETTAQVMQEISAGSINATDGVQALLKGMQTFPGAAGAMQKQSLTLLGVFSTFKDTIGQALVSGFSPVIPAIKSSLDQLTPILGDAIGQLAPALGAGLAAILPLVGELVKAIVPILTPLLKALGPALKGLGPALQPLGEALGQVAVAVAPLLPLLGQFLGASLQLLVPILLLLATVLKPLTPLINFLALAIAQFGQALGMIDWAGVGRAIAGAFVAAWNAALEFFKNIGKFFADLGTRFADGFTAIGTAIRTGIDAALSFVRSIPGRILDALGNLGSLLINAGKDLITGLWNGIASLGSWLSNKLHDWVMEHVPGPIRAALGIHSPSTLFADIGRQIPAGMGQGIEAGSADLLATLNSLVGNIATPAAAGGGGLGGVIINVGGVHFAGVVPTAAEANRTGQQVAAGITEELTRRNIALAIRMR